MSAPAPNNLTRLGTGGARRLRAPGLLLVLLALAAWPLYRLLGPRGVVVEIERKTWRLEVDVERRLLESGSNWCDTLPAGAVEQGRRLMADPAGQRPGLAEHCRYLLPAWRLLYRSTATGDAAQPLRWPQPRLSGLPGVADADLRLGPRRAFYELRLRDSKGRDWTCTLPASAWQAVPTGVSFRLPVDRFGTADCGQVPPP